MKNNLYSSKPENCKVHVGSRTRLFPEDIVMISAEISYSFIHLSDGRRIVVSTNIQKLQNRLEAVPELVRVHRSHMINILYLKSFDETRANLKNDLSCPISRRKRTDLRKALN